MNKVHDIMFIIILTTSKNCDDCGSDTLLWPTCPLSALSLPGTLMVQPGGNVVVNGSLKFMYQVGAHRRGFQISMTTSLATSGRFS